MKLGIDPKVDFAFKYLFAAESRNDLLIAFLNALLGYFGDDRIQEIELLTPFVSGEFQGDKL